MFFGLMDDIVDTGKHYKIRDFPVVMFSRILERRYKTSKITNLYDDIGCHIYGKSTLKIHKFFVPELLFLMEKYNFSPRLQQKIREKTWAKSLSSTDFPNRADLKLVSHEMNVQLKDYQAKYISEYDALKQRMNLRGYILSFEQGLGKTITSLALMTALKKKKVIIIAPKSTLESVWKAHIQSFYKEPKNIYVAGDKFIPADADFYIINYEAMDKLDEIYEYVKGSDVGIIVDESHNFLRKSAQRTQTLIEIGPKFQCTDVLLMSGTPVKAMGIEVMPMLMILDPLFDEEALVTFKRTFGVNTAVATDVLNARLSAMMYRERKENVLKLPEKFEETRKITIPNGKLYTAKEVARAVTIFTKERYEYHGKRMSEYEQTYASCIDIVKSHHPSNLKEYFHAVQYLRSLKRIDMRDEYTRQQVSFANTYEDTVILPILPQELKKAFRECKSAIKYLDLKIRGEVIGGLLSKLRTQMTSEIVAHSNIEDIIEGAQKKTIIFTSFVDTTEVACVYVRERGYKPVLISGSNNVNVADTLKTFNDNPNLNPLVATIQKLVTGVTIVIANTVVFLNQPYRHVEYVQASDRVHRIGQDTAVFIICMVLDTGEEPNLSTRMADILTWSKEMFSAIVDNE